MKSLLSLLFASLLLVPNLAVCNPTSDSAPQPWNAENTESAELAGFLKSIAGSLRPVACQYDGAKLLATSSIAAPWSCELRTAKVADDATALDVTAVFKLTGAEVNQAGVALALDFAKWDASNYVMLPGAVYNGNRNRVEYRGWCKGFNAEDFYKKDLPVTQNDIPRLELEVGKPSKIELLSCNVATPSICVFDRKAKRGFILLTEQAGRDAKGDWLRDAQGEILDSGLVIEESPERSRATLTVGAPGVRSRKPHFTAGFVPSPDRGIHAKAGDEIRLRLRMYGFETKDIPGLHEKFMAVRKDVSGPTHPRNLIPSSEILRLMIKQINARWNPRAVRPYFSERAIGWLPGLASTFPLLAAGNSQDRAKAFTTFDSTIPFAQGKSGYFHGALTADGKLTGSYWCPKELVLSKQSGDVLYFMIRQFQLLKAQGRAAEIKPEWNASIRKLADAFVKTWKENGQFGHYLNVDTGEIALYHSTASAVGIAGLALASQWYEHPEFLRIAQEAADYYYRVDVVDKGYTYGGCVDIMQHADSETPVALMTAFMTLHEITGDPQALERARQLGNLLATWVASFDYELPKKTELGALGAKMAGSIWANTQNKCGVPGIAILSGDPLFKFYRANGDRRYADLMREILHAYAEGVHPDGMIVERLSYGDADNRGNRTAWGKSVDWCEVAGALMALEIPGIYLRTDAERIFVFDAVDAKVLRRDAEGVTLSVSNPTRFDADVSIVAENAEKAKQPMDTVGFLTWPKIKIKAGETRQVMVSPEGGIK